MWASLGESVPKHPISRGELGAMRRQQASTIVLQGLARVQRTSSVRRHQSQMENSKSQRIPRGSSDCLWHCYLQLTHPFIPRDSNFRIHHPENMFKSSGSLATYLGDPD